ncbi:hypothetical protein ACLMJK_009391 [Lecanora helva]
MSGSKDSIRRAPVARMIALNHETQTKENRSFPKQLAPLKDSSGTDGLFGDRNTFEGPPVDTNALLPQQNKDTFTSPQLPPIYRVKFSMSLLDGVGDKVHTFTSMQKEVESAPKELMEISHKWMLYPPLARELKQGQINSPIFLFEAYLNVEEDLPQDNSFLAAELIIEFAERIAFDKWQVSTRIYENGNEVDLSEATYLSRPGDGRWEYLECWEPPQSDIAKIAIPLKSKWWSSTLLKIVSKRNEAGKSADPELINQEDEKTRQYIQGISLVQEIWAAPRDTDLPRHRIAIFLWEFKQSQRATTAATSWRKVHAPIPLPLQIQPFPSQYQDLPDPHLAFGAAIHPSSLPTFPDRSSLYAGSLINPAMPLVGSSQAPLDADAPFSCALTSAFDYVPHKTFTSHPLQGSFPENHHSGALLPTPSESWQLQKPFHPQDSNSSNLQDIWWSAPDLIDGDIFSQLPEPWKPLAGYSGESQDIPWSGSDPFSEDLLSPPMERWEPQADYSGESQDIRWSASNPFDGDLMSLPLEPWQLQDPFQSQKYFQPQDYFQA